MITNDRQYRITKAQMQRLQIGLDAAVKRKPSANVHPKIHVAMGKGIASQIEELQSQIDEYEALQRGEVTDQVITGLGNLSLALIRARIAARFTQKELAERLDIPEQQVQRYEATLYAGASLSRLAEVADVLALTIEEHVTYAIPSQ